ncbi:MAG: DUF72 domain-containing protein [Candidatus Wukongarchaeota archaeon]|nr:DUF72 domain-containing protein [Candidatus Wukongarchaeota archaeon]
MIKLILFYGGVGCCGWALKGGKKVYFKTFDLIELQSTFYRLPRLQTVKKWSEEVPKKFEFTVKAWQVITHPKESPTWRRMGKSPKLPLKNLKNYGYLKPTKENFEAFKKAKEICSILQAKICVIQTPPSFKFSEENLKNIQNFLKNIDRGNLILAWEPRGDWNQNQKTIKELCKNFDLIHVVDLPKRNPLSEHKIAYIRLHGLGKQEINYRYKYTEKDLKQLLTKTLEEAGHEVYVFFNNINMGEDAQKFKKICID